jgi:acetylglutamate kinase
VVVVKLGGSALTNNSLSTSFADDVTWLNSVGIKVLVIHGGGPHIEKQLKKLGKKVSFFEGIRVTDPETLDIVEMVLAGNVNKEIVELINKSGGFAVGLTGQDGNILKAKKLEIKETRNAYSNVDLGLVGEIEKINVQLLISLLNDNFIPVIAPIASGQSGETYNINADVVAGQLAQAIKAEKLILMTNTSGVLDNSGKLIPELDRASIDDLLKNNFISEGMIPKIKSALKASESGVKTVHIIDGRVEHSLLLEVLTDSGVGTMIRT